MLGALAPVATVVKEGLKEAEVRSWLAPKTSVPHVTPCRVFARDQLAMFDTECKHACTQAIEAVSTIHALLQAGIKTSQAIGEGIRSSWSRRFGTPVNVTRTRRGTTGWRKVDVHAKRIGHDVEQKLF